MAEVKWIKLSTDIFNSDKIRLIKAMPEGDAMVVMWFELLCLTGRANQNGLVMMNDKLVYTDAMLSTLFNRSPQLLQMAFETFESLGMVERIGNALSITDWCETQNVDGLDKVREQTKKRVSDYRNRLKLESGNVTCNATVTQCNATEQEQETELEKETPPAKPKPKQYGTKAQRDSFDALWALYPRKEGKTPAFTAYLKAVRQGVGDDAIAAGIKRYAKYVAEKEVEPRYIKMGSTFFNQQGWEDEYSVATINKLEGKKYVRF